VPILIQKMCQNVYDECVIGSAKCTAKCRDRVAQNLGNISKYFHFNTRRTRILESGKYHPPYKIRLVCEWIFTSNFCKCIFTYSLNLFEQAYLTNFYEEAYLLKIQSTKGNTYLTHLRFSILRARTLCCAFTGIPENSEPTLICGLGRIFVQVHRPY